MLLKQVPRLLASSLLASMLFACASEVDFGIKGVVLSSGRMLLIKDSHYPSPYWTPSHEQVKDLTEQLLVFLENSQHPIDREILDSLDEYEGQYLGFTDDRGRRLLLLNAYCPAILEDYSPGAWEVFWMTHGGRCYFQVHYDPEEKQLAYYYVSPYPGRGPIRMFASATEAAGS